jgi:hypothetical protein
MTQTIDFFHEDEDGDHLAVTDSIRGTDNLLIDVNGGDVVRVPGPALRDALIARFPLPAPEDAEPETVGRSIPIELVDGFEEGDRVSYESGRYRELRNQRGSGTVHAVHDHGAITVTQDGGSNFTYFEHELTPLEDVEFDAWADLEVEVEEDADPVAVVNAAHEYAETAAGTAYAAALVEFISGITAE